MLRALAWKEWREQRPVLLSAVGVAIVLPLFMLASIVVTSPQRDLGDVAEVLLPLYAVFLWPLFAAITGASAIAPDLSAGSLPFLLSRPISRHRLWTVKVTLALAAIVGIVTVTTFFAVGLYRLTAGAFSSWWPATISIFGAGGTAIVVAGIAASILLVFACCVCCSAFVRRPLAAAGVGLGAALVVGLTLSLAWTVAAGFGKLLIGSDAVITPATAAAVFGAPSAAVGILCASFWTFRRQRVIGSRAVFPVTAQLAGVTLVVALVGAVPVCHGAIRLAVELATDAPLPRNTVDGAIAVSEITSYRLTSQVVLLRVDGGDRRVVVPKHASSPVLSPGGEWIIYLSSNGYFGLMSGHQELRAVRTDGSDDHALVDGNGDPVEYQPNAVVSPDDGRFVYVEDGALRGISLETGEVTSISFVSEEFHSPWLIGWSSAGELLLSRSRRGLDMDGRTELLAVDLGSGFSRLVRDLRGNRSLMLRSMWFHQARRASWPWLPLFDVGEVGEETQHVLNTSNGELVRISDSACGSWGLSATGDAFYYGICAGDPRAGTARIELRVRELNTGVDEQMAVLQGHYMWPEGELIASPDGNWVLLLAREYHGRVRDLAISRDREVRELPTMGQPLLWLDNRRALVGESHWSEAGPKNRLQVVDIETRSTRDLNER